MQVLLLLFFFLGGRGKDHYSCPTKFSCALFFVSVYNDRDNETFNAGAIRFTRNKECPPCPFPRHVHLSFQSVAHAKGFFFEMQYCFFLSRYISEVKCDKIRYRATMVTNEWSERSSNGSHIWVASLCMIKISYVHDILLIEIKII